MKRSPCDAPFPYTSWEEADFAAAGAFDDAPPAGSARRLGSLRFHHGGHFSKRMVPTPPVIVSVAFDSILVTDRESGIPRRLIRYEPGFASHDVRLSPYGNQLRVAIAPDGSVVFHTLDQGWIWRYATGAIECLGPLEKAPEVIVLSRHGGRAAFVARQFIGRHLMWTARVWSLRDGARLADFEWADMFNGCLSTVEFSDEGRYLTLTTSVSAQSGSDFSEDHTWCIEGVEAEGPGEAEVPAGVFLGHRAVTSIAISSNGRHVVTSDLVWDRKLDLVVPIATLIDQPMVIGIHGGCSYRVFSSGRVLKHDLRRHVDLPDTSLAISYFNGAGISADGARISLVDGRKAFMLEPGTWKSAKLTHEAPAYAFSIACQSTGSRVAAGATGSVCSWDGPRHVPRVVPITPLSGEVRQIAWSPDERYLAAGTTDGFIVLKNDDSVVGSLQVERRYAGRNSIAFSPDGRLLAAALGDWTFGLWQVEPWLHLATLRGHLGAVTALAFTPGARREILSGSEDGTVLVWPVDAVLQHTKNRKA